MASLRKDVAAAPGAFDDASVEAIVARVAEDRERALERARAALRGARYAALLEQIAAVSVAPPLASMTSRRSASDVLPALARRRLKRLGREARTLSAPLDDDALRRLRTRVRRALSATEAAAPLVGSAARRAARKLAELDDLLREHRHARVAVGRLRALADGAPVAELWTAAVLSGMEHSRAAACRASLETSLERLARGRSWVSLR